MFRFKGNISLLGAQGFNYRKRLKIHFFIVLKFWPNYTTLTNTISISRFENNT